MARRRRSRARPRSSAPLPLEEALAQLEPAALRRVRDAAERGQRELSRVLARRARRDQRTVSEVVLSPDGRSAAADVLGTRSSPYRVEVTLRPSVDTTCSCPYSQGYDECKHGWAVLDHLAQAVRSHLDAARRGEAESAAAATTRSSRPKAQSPWQRQLAALDQVLAEHAPGASATPPAADPSITERVVWRIDLRSPTLSVQPYLQTRRKDGTFTGGRRMSLDRLLRVAERSPQPVVRQIAGLVEHELQASSWYGADLVATLDPLRAVRCLAGVAEVFDAASPSHRVEVRQAEMRIALEREERGALRLVAHVDGDPPPATARFHETDGHLLCVRPATRRIAFQPVAPGYASVVLQVAKKPVRVPKRATEAVLRRVASLQRLGPVHVPEELEGPPLPGDVRPILRASAAVRGSDLFRVHLLVHPHPETPVFPPGEGQIVSQTLADGRLAPVVRDPDAERAAATAACEWLGLDPRADNGLFAWTLEGVDPLLDLLGRAKALGPEALRVELPEEGLFPRLVGLASAQSLRVEVSAQGDWFGLAGGIEVDGERLRLAALLDAIRDGRRYVEVARDRFVEIAAELRERLGRVGEVVRANAAGLTLGRTDLPAVEGALAEVEQLVVDPAWEAARRRYHAALEVDTDPPEGLQAELRPYQREGIAWLLRLSTWGVGACLADDMGLGKTLQALAVLLARREAGPALVICPMSVMRGWRREAARFAPGLSVRVLHGAAREVGEPGAGDVLVTSYATARSSVADLRAVPWGTLVLDEAQRVKNATTLTARAIRTIPADWRLALTGTPLQNHLGDLWSLFRQIEPGLFGSWESFRRDYACPIEKRHDPERAAALARRIQPFVLRRTKGEVLPELPARMEETVRVALSPAERERYDDARLAALVQLEGLGEGARGPDGRFHVLAALTRLRQLACHPVLVDPSWTGSSAKLDRTLEILEARIGGGHRALVFSQFTRHLRLVREEVERRGMSCAYLDGATPSRTRQRRIDAFEAGEGQVFLISLKAGGTGLNLVGADTVLHLDPWWNPATEDQASDRAHRIGQRRTVQVFRLVAEGTVEEEILRLHGRKRDLIAAVLDGSDRASKLSTEELIGLIRGKGGTNGGLRSAAGLRAGDPANGSRGARPKTKTKTKKKKNKATIRKKRGKKPAEVSGRTMPATGRRRRSATRESDRRSAAPARAAAARGRDRPPAPDPALDLGEILRPIRAMFDWSQGRLGQELAVSASRVSRYERGLAQPSLAVTRRIQGLLERLR